MKYNWIILGLILLSSNINAQVICLEFEDSTASSSKKVNASIRSFIGQSIEISQFSIYFQDQLFSSKNVEHKLFSGKNSLINKYQELDGFSNFSDSLYGDISIYYFQDSIASLNTNKFEVIKIKDHGIQKYYVNLSDCTFVMKEGDPKQTSCFAEGLHLKEFDIDGSLIITKQARYKSEIFPAQFERKHEMVMFDPSRSYLQINPARFETVTETVLETQINTCPEFTAEYESFEEQILVKDGYTEMVQIPETFDTLIKMELVKDGYNKLIDFIPHIYETYEGFSASSGLSESIIPNIRLKDDCTHQVFLPCIELTSNSNTSNKEIFQIEQTKFCPEGYETLSSGCYKIDSVGPNYKARQYVKLVKRGSVKTEHVAPVYGMRTYKKIKNKKQIPPKCIKTEYTTIQYQKLSNDAETVRTFECPNYKKRYYFERVKHFEIVEEIKEQPETIRTKRDKILYSNVDDHISIEVVCQKFIDANLINRILDRLRHLGYDIPLENDRQAYLEALTDYQKKNNLIIGVLSIETLNHLGVLY